MILSFDTIMIPEYEVTSEAIALISSISEKLGQIKAYYLNRPSPMLRKQNKIKTIHSSLKIEGNTLSMEQMTALMDNKKVVGPKKDIVEVLNAMNVYEKLIQYKPFSEKSFLTAHKELMQGLIEQPGTYRKQSVGIMKGKHMAHIAPPAKNIPYLMKDLFNYLKVGKDHVIIKSCVFHYELEFIHPFMDGNGRMGRLWQTLTLCKSYPVFEFLPFETLIANNQKAYYNALAISDRIGKATPFIEYMLNIIDRALGELLLTRENLLNEDDRITHFISMHQGQFTRKDYLNVFKNISSATASRDLRRATELGILEKEGEKNKSFYIVK